MFESMQDESPLLEELYQVLTGKNKSTFGVTMTERHLTIRGHVGDKLVSATFILDRVLDHDDVECFLCGCPGSMKDVELGLEHWDGGPWKVSICYDCRVPQ